MKYKLFDELEKIIDKHIEEIVSKKIKSFDQKNKDLIKKEVDKILSEKNKTPFEDIFKSKCSLSDMTKDHVIPANKKGSNNKSNIMMMCKSSNQSKGNLLDGEVNGIKFKVIEDNRGKPFKDGTKKGNLSILDEEKNLWQTISTRKENNRYDKWIKENK